MYMYTLTKSMNNDETPSLSHQERKDPIATVACTNIIKSLGNVSELLIPSYALSLPIINSLILVERLYLSASLVFPKIWLRPTLGVYFDVGGFLP